MDAWRVSLAVDGDVLLDIGLAALTIMADSQITGRAKVPAMSVATKDPHRLKVRYRDYLPVSL